MLEYTRIKATYGKPWADQVNLPVSPQLLAKVGECMVKLFAKEALKDFAKRGWSVKDPMGGPDIGDSFSYRVRGGSTVEVTSTFYGMDYLTQQAVPEHRMTWLTQEAHGTPKKVEQTPLQTATGMMKKVAQAKSGKGPAKRKTLVVPLRAETGEIIFRTAPLRFQDAWIHPGIAKFTFAQRAMKKGKEECMGIISEYIKDQIREGNVSFFR